VRQRATRQGLDEEIVAQIHLSESERRLDRRDGLAVRFAEKMAADPRSIDSAFKAELAEHFSALEIVELGMMIGQYLSWSRMLVMLGGHKGACEIFVPDAAPQG
jgi:alkylhydroperoxidase family enzyme